MQSISHGPTNILSMAAVAKPQEVAIGRTTKQLTFLIGLLF